jgi:phosphoglycerate kinase
MIRQIEQLDLAGKRVFIRVDFNVPLDKKPAADARSGIGGAGDGRSAVRVKDDARIRAALPTIKYAIGRGAKVILASHLGRPDGKVVPGLSLEPAGAVLSHLLGQDVTFADDCVGDGVRKNVADLREGKVLLLENLRFHPEEEANDDAFSRELASLADVYVDDAFGTVHRAHASTVGMVKYVASRGAGYLVASELEHLRPLLQGAKKPYLAILGGAKVSDKIKVIDQLMGKVDGILIGGAMAYTFLSASHVPVGASRVEKDKIDVARGILHKAAKARVEISLPVDHVVAREPKGGIPTEVVSSIGEGQLGLDIGPRTSALYVEKIVAAQTVFWNGPMGMFETKEYAAGTRAVADALVEATRRGARTVVGGGDSAAAIAEFGLSAKVTHVSTGGGASLEFLEGRDLPGLKILDE